MQTCQKPRIVAVISEFEQTHFFPDGINREGRRHDLPPIAVHNPSEVRDNWVEFLTDKRPSIIIGGWDMPPLPSRITHPALSSTPLEYVCYLAGSVRGKIPRDWIESDLLVSNWGGSISRVVAESALMMILASLRCVADSQYRLHQTTNDWRHPARPERSLFHRRVGIHGFGKVAQSLVSLLRPFNVHLRTYAPGTADSILERCDTKACNTLQELFEWSEIFIEAAPLIPQTRGVVNAQLLRLLPQEAVFVNIGRGPVLIEKDLLDVAQERRLRLALDVFETEPLPPDSPLRQRPEILLMPHQGGPTLDRCRDAGTFSLMQIARYLNGDIPDAAITAHMWESIT